MNFTLNDDGTLPVPPGFAAPPSAPPLENCPLCLQKFDRQETRMTTITYHKQACQTIQFRNQVTKFNCICWICGKVCGKNNVRVSCFLILIIFAFLHIRKLNINYKSTIYCMLTEVSPMDLSQQSEQT